jgi:alkylhydroperoxidase family enzyme
VKLTLAPGAMGSADVEGLRTFGFADDAISIAVQVISYFNYINRIADGLGVDAEDWMTPGPDEWQAEKGKGYESVFS